MSSWTIMILEPIRGMRTSHCSKTYQLGRSRAANSACFRDFLRLITGFWGVCGPSGGGFSIKFHALYPFGHALSRPAGLAGMLSHLWRGLARRSCSCSLRGRGFGGFKCGRPQPGGWGLDRDVLSGGVLLSHTLPGAVPSALWVLASGFGMGPGVSPTL